MARKVLQSRAINYLKGRTVPQLGVGKIESITKRGDRRTVTDVLGNKTTINKAKLLKAFNSALSSDQRTAMAKTIRVNKDDTATMRLGGLKKGVRKTYVNKQAAVRALNRRYGK